MCCVAFFLISSDFFMRMMSWIKWRKSKNKHDNKSNTFKATDILFIISSIYLQCNKAKIDLKNKYMNKKLFL